MLIRLQLLQTLQPARLLRLPQVGAIVAMLLSSLCQLMRQQRDAAQRGVFAAEVRKGGGE
jgi:hypothetical protein